ncbi:MAG: hypothetical protein H6672_04685 [Anaerolineaceae bacterium]|nr:hypothetical protein [Anaerolineaceae bacterium]
MNNLSTRILLRTLSDGIGLGILGGLLFQMVFFRLTWDSILLGAGFGAFGGFIVGLTNGIAASTVLSRLVSPVSNIRAFHRKLNGILLVTTILTVAILVSVIFSPFTGYRIFGLLLGFPVMFFASICSLIGSQWLGNWYLRQNSPTN